MISSICVCGSGTMGAGIAQLSAQSGFHTILYDLRDDLLMKAREQIQSNLQLLKDKGKLDESDPVSLVNGIVFTTDITLCKANFIIEAIVEDLQAKRSLLQELSLHNDQTTIYASNTSSLSITEIAGGLEFSDKIAGMHFFNPAPIMKLVELVHTAYSSPQTISIIKEVAHRMGKQTVSCKDAPGFIVNHVARPYYKEAFNLVELSEVDFKQIDRLVEASGFRMGPFRLMDLIGNDINYSVSSAVYEALQKPERLKPSIIQKEMVEKKFLGRKTQKGYYDY